MRAWPDTGQAEAEAAAEVLHSRKLIDGPREKQAERMWARQVGASYCIAVSNCTAAIQIALAAHGIGPGDSVVVPALSFSGTVLPVSHLGAIPRFADVNPDTGNLSIESVTRMKGDARACVPVHLHGHPVATGPLRDRFEVVVEDGCQAHGAAYDGVPVGRHGTVCWSTSSSKMLAAPDGGFITTDDPDVAERCIRLRSFGTLDKTDVEDRRGHNWRMSELTAAILCVRIPYLNTHLRYAKAAAERLNTILNVFDTPPDPPHITHGWHKYRLRFPSPTLRDAAANAFGCQGVPYHYWQTRPMSRYTAFRNEASEDTQAHMLLGRSVLLGYEDWPIHTWGEAEFQRVAESLLPVLRRSNDR